MCDLEGINGELGIDNPGLVRNAAHCRVEVKVKTYCFPRDHRGISKFELIAIVNTEERVSGQSVNVGLRLEARGTNKSHVTLNSEELTTGARLG